jgi:predicted RNA binding protein YcfA (HicA-like mRNA interferase family)
MVMVRPGARVNLSIPAHDSVKPGTLRRLIRDMGLTVDGFLERARK